MNRILILLSATIIFFTIVGCSVKSSVPPILLLARQNNFGIYTGEILKAEGFNEFIIDSLNTGKADKSFLDKFDLVICSEPVSDRNSADLLEKYVKNGGNLIAFEPSGLICDIFGIEQVQGEIKNSFLSIDTSSAEGRGLTFKRIQNHLVPDKYKLKGAGSVAWFSGSSSEEDEFPAVVTNTFGKGHAAAFLYNLPKNIIYTRQGNPEYAGIEKDGIPGLRAMDLFTDGWVDTSNNTINQADEQMALLSHCIELMQGTKKPLPRLWYFPDTLKCLVTLTNDGEFRGENDFETQFRDVDSMGAKMSLYVMETGKVTKNFADRWTSRGFEITGHPDDTKEASDPVWDNMQKILGSKIKEISDLYGLKMTTVVNHWFVWCGNNAGGKPEFAAQAEIEANYGLSMDINYAHYDNKSGQGHYLGQPGIDQGNFTGSGLPMKFSTSSGKILDIYQHLNNVYDQQYNENHDPEGFFNCFRGLIDRSLFSETYSYISIKSHNDEYYFSKAPLLKMIDYANSKKIPVWTASHLLAFLKTRDEAGFSGIVWSHNRLTFKLSSGIPGPDGLTLLLPLINGHAGISSVNVNNQKIKFGRILIKGTEYAFVTLTPGQTYKISVLYI